MGDQSADKTEASVVAQMPSEVVDCATSSQNEHSTSQQTIGLSLNNISPTQSVNSQSTSPSSHSPSQTTRRFNRSTTSFNNLLKKPFVTDTITSEPGSADMSNNAVSRPLQADRPSPKLPIVNLSLRPNGASPQSLSRPQLLNPQPNGKSPHPGPHPSPNVTPSQRKSHPRSNQRASNRPSPPPLQSSSSVRGSAHLTNQPCLWAGDPELKLYVRNLPPGVGTLQIHQLLSQHGTLIRIEIQEPRRHNCTNASVVFCPPPTSSQWIRTGVDLADGSRIRRYHVEFEVQPPKRLFRHKSPSDPSRWFQEEMKVPATQLHIGVMKNEDSLLELYTATGNTAPIDLTMNLQRKCLDVHFAISKASLSSSKIENNGPVLHYYKMRLSFTQVKIVRMHNSTTGQIALIMSTDMPPLTFRKTQNVKDTHEVGATRWTEWQTWYRQTEISARTDTARDSLTQLQKENAVIDIGRWLTYRLVVNKSTASSESYGELYQALKDHNLVIGDRIINFESGQAHLLWSWLDNPTAAMDNFVDTAMSSELYEMAEESTYLPFDVRYQLEACVSHGYLHECNIDKDFLRRLAAMEHARAVKLLEKVMDEKERYYKSDNIFARLLPKVSIVRKKVPTYCAMVRSATVTPTTMYLLSPTPETSNRVIRHFRKFEDRFLRVKFTDEKYKGRVISNDGASMNEIFTRIKRTMTNGIKVGDRLYEFLAFGSSQLREAGAYFFASTPDCTAQQIRDWMGNFTDIKIVAKYCARVGQSFSTTRAVDYGVLNIERIQDINRNGYCFTDGIGKISPFLAQMIAQVYKLPNSTIDYPSVFQFRLGGSKGVLAVDSALKWNTVQIRPSQEKFSTTDYRGLDICRISQFSAANLNVQIILVLSALGVKDEAFLAKMRHMLSDLEVAMHEERMALELLQKNIDFNQMTLQLASMVLDGFMETQDPFTVSCLRLWRSWSIKYLKEKARIYIEQGAFVLGCVDETATLNGHFDDLCLADADNHDLSFLPEIFLQIPDPTYRGKWKVLEGVCIVARNPSLHPGDIRVVHAVDFPALHHMRDCVVFPQTGDRDLANMCSGGDLDGDDFLVMWDQDLIPQEWNHPAMNYEPPPPKLSDGPVTVDDMTSFFVTHMKHDNVAPIAVNHRYWADALPDGVKDPICVELAGLHSMAVDYAKTGVPAELSRRLRVNRWPHWAEVKNKPNNKVYDSKRVLGKLYDTVQRVNFQPVWDFAFDERILKAYELDGGTLKAAQKTKEDYDEGVRRIMSKFSIKSELEVRTTFVLEHSDDIGDYKFSEMIGEAIQTLVDHHRKLIYDAAGTSDKDRDWSKLGPFIAAMYTVTAQEVTDAIAECQKVKLVRGQWIPVKKPTAENMPFMSFPWLFPTELGRIANKHSGARDNLSQSLVVPRKLLKKSDTNILGGNVELAPLPEITFPSEAMDDGSVFNTSRTTDVAEGRSDAECHQGEIGNHSDDREHYVDEAQSLQESSQQCHEPDIHIQPMSATAPSEEIGGRDAFDLLDLEPLPASEDTQDVHQQGDRDKELAKPTDAGTTEAVTGKTSEEDDGYEGDDGDEGDDPDEGYDADEEDGVEVVVTASVQNSALDALERLLA